MKFKVGDIVYWPMYFKKGTEKDRDRFEITKMNGSYITEVKIVKIVENFTAQYHKVGTLFHNTKPGWTENDVKLFPTLIERKIPWL